MSVLSGQNIELRRQVAKGELDTRAMLQQLEKKQCEVSTIWETTELYKKHTAARILGRIGIACSMAPN